MASTFKGRTEKGYKTPSIIFERPVVNTYKLVTKAKILDDTKEAVIVTEPVLVDSFDVSKVVKENAKGHSIKDVALRVMNGDDSILNNDIVFADSTGLPEDKADGLMKNLVLSNQFSNFTDDQVNFMKDVLKMSDKEILDYINKFKDKSQVKEDVSKATDQNVDKDNIEASIKTDNKEVN